MSCRRRHGVFQELVERVTARVELRCRATRWRGHLFPERDVRIRKSSMPDVVSSEARPYSKGLLSFQQ